MGTIKMPAGVPVATYKITGNTLPAMSFLHGKRKKKPQHATRLHGDRILGYHDVYGHGGGGGKGGKRG